MKFFILSDIHGSKKYLDLGLKRFEAEKCDYLVLLGDILYHGPRNPLPQGYDPASVAETLNPYKDKIIAVRGNCDSEVDQMVLDFPMMGDYQILFHENKKIFITHGHLYNKTNMPKLSKGDIFIHGHFHLPMTERVEGVFYLNPGSVTLPKNNQPNSYGIIHDNNFFIKDLDGEVINHIQLLP
jgi:putative phosphoesterase